MERAAKLRRLEGLRRGNPHISASALSSLVQDIQVNGLPDLYSRKHIKEARDIKLQEMTAYGPLFSQAPVIHKDGTERQLLFVFFFFVLCPFSAGWIIFFIGEANLATLSLFPREALGTCLLF